MWRNDANLDHLGGDKSNTTSPAFGRVVQNIVDVEVRILSSQLVQFLLEQDVVRVDIGEDQVHLGGVVAAITGAVANDGLDNLKHRGDPGTTSNHTNVTAHVGSVDHGTLGTAHFHGIANLQGGQVLGDVTLRVGLHEQIKVTGFIVRRYGGVRADNLLRLALNSGGEGDVLTNGQTKDIGGTGKGEAIDANIVRDVGLLLEHEFLELCRVENLSGLCRGEIVCQYFELPSGGRQMYVLLLLLVNSFNPARTAARATAYGTNSFFTRNVPKMRRAEGM